MTRPTHEGAQYLWQYVLHVMNPITEGGIHQLSDWYALEVEIGDEVVAPFSLFIFLLFFVECVEAERRNLCSGGNAGNLCAKVICLIAWERRKAHNLKKKKKKKKIVLICCYVCAGTYARPQTQVKIAMPSEFLQNIALRTLPGNVACHVLGWMVPLSLA